MIIPTAASAILVAQQVNKACGGNNCGLTIDYGHQKMEATTASTSCDLAAYAGVPVHKFDINDARQGRNDQDLMFGTMSIPESVEYLYTTFVRDYRGYYSQDQFTYREDPTRAIERSMINFANLALKAVRMLRRAAAPRPGARRRHRSLTCSTSSRRSWSDEPSTHVRQPSASEPSPGPSRRTRSASTSAPTRFAPSSCRAPTAARSARSVFDYPSGDQGVLLHPKRSASGAAESGRLHRTACASRSSARWHEAAATPGFSRDRVIGIGVDTTGSTPLPIDAHGAAAGARSALARQPRGARVAVEGPHRRRRSGRDHGDGQRQHAPELPRADRRHLFVGVVVVEDLEVPEGGAGRVRRRAHSWVELADFVPGRARRRRRSATHRPLRLRRRATRRCTRDAWGGLPSKDVSRAARSEARRVCAIASTTRRIAAGHAGGTVVRRVGDGARPAARASRSRWAASTRTTARSAPASQPGTLVKIIGTSTCDCAIAAVSDRIGQHPRHLRHRQRLDHAGLLRHRGGAVGGRRHPEVVGRRRVRGRRGAARRSCRARRPRCKPGESGLLALDWNNGNRTVLVDPRLTGLIVGQTLHTTRAEIYRALIEATAFGARAIIERLREYGVADRSRGLLRRHRREERRLHADLRRRASASRC